DSAGTQYAERHRARRSYGEHGFGGLPEQAARPGALAGRARLGGRHAEGPDGAAPAVLRSRVLQPGALMAHEVAETPQCRVPGARDKVCEDMGPGIVYGIR